MHKHTYNNDEPVVGYSRLVNNSHGTVFEIFLPKLFAENNAQRKEIKERKKKKNL